MFKYKEKYTRTKKSNVTEVAHLKSSSKKRFPRLAKKIRLPFKKSVSNKQILTKAAITLGIVILYRAMSVIPLPGVDMSVFQEYFGKASASEASYLFLIFTGSRLDTPSIVGLGLAAYINASIILQLLTPVIPKLTDLSKEGERGRQVINQWTRFLTLPLAFFYSIAYLMLIARRDLNSADPSTVSSDPIFLIPHAEGSDWPTITKLIFMAFVLTVGAMILMWLSEIITEKGLGNGSSIIISIGIIAALPSLLKQDFSSINISKIFNEVIGGNLAALSNDLLVAMFLVLLGFLVLIVAIVFVNESTRNIDIQYARRVRSGQDTASSSLPIKLTITGVLPIIFASALLSMPQLIIPFLLKVVSTGSSFYDILTKINGSFLLATNDNVVDRNDVIYAIVYFLLIIGFALFYSFIVMKPDETAENLQKSGAFIPGIRPGKSTANYISYVLLRISFVGGVFLAVLALTPLIGRDLILISTDKNLTILSGIGGTSILIVVSVVLETMRQYRSMKVTSSYEKYI
jgi:preprotein translocase subunit SecY